MNHCSILLVDDNPLDIELTLTALGAETGEVVKVVTSGREALEYLKASSEHHPDLILLDLNMPHMNGFEVLDAIREQEETRDIPVFILTTSSEDSDRRACYEHGASGFVVKAIDLSQFFEAMERVRQFWQSLRTPRRRLI